MDRAPTPDEIPTEALRFGATFEFAEPPSEGGPRRLRGVAYSGDALNHPWWGCVIFDLSTTEAPERMPVLVDHDRAKRAGVAQMRITPDRIEIGDGFLLPNDVGASVAADADAGFPWQLSVHIEPREIQMLSGGESAEVNGRKVEGPAAVFRNSLLREVSFTPTGVDSNTSASVFSLGAAAKPKEAPMTDPAKTESNADLEAARAELAIAKTSLQAASEQVATLTGELETVRAELATIRTETRMSAVKALFSDLGREFTDDAAAPYIAMETTAFAAVAADMRAAKPKPAANLFGHVATDGATTTTDTTDPHKFAAAIRAEQDKAAAEGRTLNVLEAAQIVRDSAAAAAA